MAKDMSREPVYVSIGQNSGSEGPSANADIEQNFLFSRSLREKRLQLLRLIEGMREEAGGSMPKTLIFVARKADAETLAHALEDEGFPSDALHGDMKQRARENVMRGFRKGDVRILVATDVASRGLDVPDIDVVVNFDFPTEARSPLESYVHRIGRTGRSGNKGCAHSMLLQKEMGNSRVVGPLVDLVQRAGQIVPAELEQAAAALASRSSRRGGGGGGGGGGRGGFGRGRGRDRDDSDHQPQRRFSKGSRGRGSGFGGFDRGNSEGNHQHQRRGRHSNDFEGTERTDRESSRRRPARRNSFEWVGESGGHSGRSHTGGSSVRQRARSSSASFMEKYGAE